MNISSMRDGAEMSDVVPTPVWELEAELGEGPVWVQRDRALWFVDIKKHYVHRFDPATGEKRTFEAPEQVAFILPAEAGGFVAGLQSGLFRFDDGTGAFERIVEVEGDLPNNRLNDGVTDPAGRLWFGTMDNKETANSGAYYSFYHGKLTATGIDKIAITNGPAVSPDGRTLYLVDTLAGTIETAEIKGDVALGERRPFVTIDPGDGHPDGPTVDSQGCLWIALYNGWEVRRYSPIGDLLETVHFPVANITKIAFGGDDLRTVFATTARQMLSPEVIARQPLIGSLFQFRVDVPGVPCPLAQL
jgi:D-xylonolactonase